MTISKYIEENLKISQIIFDELQAQNRDNKISIILDKSTNK